MQTNPQQWIARTVGFLIAALIAVPATLSATPASAAVPDGAPGPIPSIHYGGNGPQSVSLSWDVPFTPGSSAVTDYRIEYRQPGGEWSVFEDGVSVTTAATVTGLATGRDYEFRVAAVNLAGVGPKTVLGGLTDFQPEQSSLCGKDAISQMWCVDWGVNRKSWWVNDYESQLPDRRIYDVVSLSKMCALSTSLGVVCGSERNLYGELGRGFVGGRGGAFVVPGLPDNVISVATLGETYCALTSSHDLWCWGRWNEDTYAKPILVPTIVQRDVTTFSDFCALHADNSVSCLKPYGGEFRWINHPDMPPMRTIGYGYDGRSCGIALDKSVICFWPFDTSGYTVIDGITDAQSVVVGNSNKCALLVSGTVTCWGDNTKGNLGDGTRTSGMANVRLPEPVVSIVRPQGMSYFGATCATGVSSTLYCWGDYLAQVANGRQGPFYMPVEVSSVGAFRAHGMDAPGKVSSVTQTAARATSVTIEWSPVVSVAPVTGYIVSWRPQNATSWSTAQLTTSAREWTSPTLPKNTVLDVTVTAVNAAGPGTESDVISVATTMPPSRMPAPTITESTASSVTVGWQAAADRNEPVTGYRLEWSTDRSTWQSVDLPNSARQKTFTGMMPGTAIDVRISALNAAGASVVSPTATGFVSGLSSHTIKIVDSWGQSAYGGQITWRKSGGSFQSALDYGLTAEGRATFPAIPAGPVDVTLRGIQLPGGALVEYEATTMIGFTSDSTIMLPAEPSFSQHVVRVLLPNGLPVVGANVSATNLSNFATVADARFTIGSVISSGVTNEFGEVYLAGYSSRDSIVQVEYNDGILIQRATRSLGDRDVEFTLENMPWLDTPVVTSETANGSLVTLTVTANSSDAARGMTTRSIVGASVSIEPPAGASQKCAGKKLSAPIEANGTATLLVCASKSGRYVLHGKGVVSTGAVSLNVKGAPAVAVSNARAISPEHGKVTVTWNAPAYTGGSPITKYTVTLKRGKSTITKVVTGTTAVFTGLPGASTWSVAVTATSKVGTSEPARMLVPVS